ncbi:MAG TPA: 50S ribosomal protein L17 [Candidatus Paceibacterota bacterium]|jgi:large subunit ribosomal protein L17|nr:50S ribosomal protein L17 [Candidatus Paceibacterota bacterium]
MRHHNHNRKFGRKSNVRKAFMRSLARALVMEGRIMTTEPRAKELRPYVEKMITRAKTGNAVTNLRILASDMGGQLDVAQKLIKDIAPKYVGRNGGYIRIMKTPARASDAAPMALIEFV